MPRLPQRISALRHLHSILGGPGLLIAAVSIASFVFGSFVVVREYDLLRRTGRGAFRDVLVQWVRITPVDDINQTLRDYAEAYRLSTPGPARDASARDLQTALDRLAAARVPDDASFASLRIDRLQVRTKSGQILAQWATSSTPSASTSPADEPLPLTAPDDPSGGHLELLVRYRPSPSIQNATSSLEISYRRLLLAVLGLAGYSLLCLAYMIINARSLRERVAIESAQAATLDLADRTCHELGNVTFVLANERRNLESHLDLVEELANQSPEILASAARRAGLDGTQLARLRSALDREQSERGLDPQADLAPSLSVARDVCRQVAVCSEYIAMTVRELDGFLRRSTQPVSVAPVPVAECLADALALLRPRLESAGARVETPDHGSQFLHILADRRLVVHALVNVLKNALEATAGAGIAPILRIEASVQGPVVWIDVSDNGPGIPEPNRRRAFELGFSTKGAGRGRGLAIARESLRIQVGRLELLRTSPTGSTFRITLPTAGSQFTSLVR